MDAAAQYHQLIWSCSAAFERAQRSACPVCFHRRREWPYEHIVPGIPKNDPPYNGGKQKGHKRYLTQQERQQKIEAAMAKMPQLIADYRVSHLQHTAASSFNANGYDCLQDTWLSAVWSLLMRSQVFICEIIGCNCLCCPALLCNRRRDVYPGIRLILLTSCS